MCWQEVPSGQPSHDAVGRPIPHMSAKQQVTGEAKYVDDLPKLEGNEINSNYDLMVA